MTSLRCQPSTIDLLELPFRKVGAVTRNAGQFTIEEAWALMRFGPHELSQGWWVFECDSRQDLSGVELRLSSGRHPLIVLSNDHADRSTSVRLHFEKSESFELALMISPWPGQYEFGHLRLRRLGVAEILLMFTSGFKKVFVVKNGFQKAANVVSHFLRGRTLGLRLQKADIALPSRWTPTAPPPEQPAPASVRVVHHPDLSIVLRADDILDERALEIVRRKFSRSEKLQVIYSDVWEGGSMLPRTVRDELLTRFYDVAQPPLFFRAGAIPQERDPSAWVDEAVLRYGHAAVERICLPLATRAVSHWPLLAALPAPTIARQPSVSIVIPTKFRIDLLKRCLEGLALRTDYAQFDVVIVDNGVTDSNFVDLIDWAKQRLSIIVIRDDGPFNFSRLVNRGVATSKGEVVVLMNDDIEPNDPTWLVRMLDSVLCDDVGAVGARLLYEDRSIQHAGVSMGIGGVCGHLWRGLSEEEALRCPYIVYPGERIAVTGACLALRRDLYEKAGGLDEQAFPVALNDIDLCLKVRELGYRTVYRGDAVLFHYESQSRGQDSVSDEKLERAAKETALFFKKWAQTTWDDPFGSPEYDQRVESGAINKTPLQG